MDLTKETYDRIADDWHANHQGDTWWIEGTDRFISFLPAGSTVIDVSCGDGSKIKYLLSKGLKVTGLDYSKGLLAITERENPEAECILGDLHDLDKWNRKFDAVYASAVLLHVPRAEACEAVEKLVSVLRPGGHLFVAVKRIRNGVKEEIKVQNNLSYEYKRFFSYFEPNEIRRHFLDSGLKIVWEKVLPSGRIEWIQVIGRKPLPS